MMTARGKLQRIAVREISVIGRNTQGVRVMKLGKDDSLAAIVRVPKEENGESAVGNGDEPGGDQTPIAEDQTPLAQTPEMQTGDQEPPVSDQAPSASDETTNDEPESAGDSSSEP